jgi:hypothetical protein
MASLDPVVRSLTADELAALATGELLSLSRAILAELRHREVIRSGNAPAGDYAELLVRVATGGELAPASQKSWDVIAPDGERLQVKARVVTNPRRAGERQLSVFRSWDFDAAVVVFLDDEFRVWRATRLPAATLKQVSRFVEHVKGYRVIANDALLEQGVPGGVVGLTTMVATRFELPLPSSNVTKSTVVPDAYAGLASIRVTQRFNHASPVAAEQSCMSSQRFGVTKENDGSWSGRRSDSGTSQLAQARRRPV